MEPGELVDGRFRVGQQVGSGGMGVVMRAVDETTGQTVALKLLDGQGPSEVERARREANILEQLAHPAIVGYVADGVTAAGRLYLAMEWIDGITVADRLARDGFTLDEAIALTRQIAGALAVAHDAGVLHRDVKPSNVLLHRSEPGRATLIDFGVARIADPVRSITRTGAAIGTPGYMSPEQARGERAITEAADVFGLGCVLYECATGRPAFSGSLATAVMAKILFGEPSPVDQMCPEAPAALGTLVARMIRKRASERVASCREVCELLDAIGPIAGPRRSSRSAISEPTVRPDAGPPKVHCMVGAARGSPDDMLQPPNDDQRHALAQAASRHGGTLEVLATGAVVAHVIGEPTEATHRAAALALEMCEILPDWSLVVSSYGSDFDAIADRGARQLTAAALGAIFHRPGMISVDPDTERAITDEFEVAAGPNRARHLVRRRQR